MQKLQISKSLLKSLLLGAYIVGVLAFSVASRAEVGSFPVPVRLHPHAQLIQLQGHVVVEEQTGRFYLVTESKAFHLDVPATSDVQLESYTGQVVQIVGAVMKRQIQPVIAGIGSAVTDGETRGEVAPPTVFVLRISGTADYR